MFLKNYEMNLENREILTITKAAEGRVIKPAGRLFRIGHEVNPGSFSQCLQPGN